MLSSYIRDTRRRDSRSASLSFHRVPQNCSQNEVCYCSNGLVNYTLCVCTFTVRSRVLIYNVVSNKHVRRRYECGVRNDQIFLESSVVLAKISRAISSRKLFPRKDFTVKRKAERGEEERKRDLIQRTFTCDLSSKNSSISLHDMGSRWYLSFTYNWVVTTISLQRVSFSSSYL